MTDSFWFGAMAAIAVGMFLGIWVIGPAVSGDPIENERLRSAKVERQQLLAAMARPDPSPYRTPTPDFGKGDAPQYGTIARQEARAGIEAGGEKRSVIAQSQSYDASEQRTDDPPFASDTTWTGYAPPKATTSHRYRRVDRASDVSSY